MRVIVWGSVLFVVIANLAHAQNWELGGGAGYAFSNDNTVRLNSLSADAGLKHGYMATAYGGQHLYKHLSGELRYIFRSGDPRVSDNSSKAQISGDTHTVNYDFLLHTNSSEAHIRPYIAFGGGVKVFRGTGIESANQPLGDFVLLTQTQETLPLFSIGGGVSLRLASYAVLRLEFRDHVTPFPSKVLVPGPGANVGGTFHDFLPMVNIGLRF